MSSLKVKNIKEFRRYQKNLKNKPNSENETKSLFEKRILKLEKKQTENNTRLNYIMKKLLEIDLKIH